MKDQTDNLASEIVAFETMSLEGLVSSSNGTASDHEFQLGSGIHTPLDDDDSEPAAPIDPFEVTHEKLGVMPLAVLIFYSVSGGPFGCEASVRSGGNFYTLAGFLILPFVWSLPEALITAELGTVFQEASGGVAWVEEAFGPFAGWMCGFLGYIAGSTDNAIYPVLFLEYLLQVLFAGNDNLNPMLRFSLLSGTSICLAYVNWLGLPLVGKMSITICCIAMSPFIVLTVIGAFEVDPSRWFERPATDVPFFERNVTDDTAGGFFPHATVNGIMLRPWLNNLFWNLNSFDASASFAAEIEDPGRVLPKAMGWSVLMVVAGYFFPLLIAIGATSATHYEWVDGYLATVASEIAGPWLSAWTVFGVGISNIALFQAELSADAFQLMGMADRKYVPKIFATRSRHGTPTYGILLGLAVIVVMGMADLGTLIEMLNFNYSISLLLECCAFIKLRITDPDLERPFRIPLNTTGCILMLIPTFAVTLIVMSLATFQTLAFSLAVNLIGITVFKCRKHSGMMHKAMRHMYDPIMSTGNGDSSVTGSITEEEEASLESELTSRKRRF